MRWLQARKAQTKHEDSHSREAIRRVEQLINSIPADLLARRAMECGQYARALFHLEPHAAKMRDNAKADPDETTRLMSELQFIYTQIDEPDGLEGISASLGVVDLNQQILSHRKAGRWSQAQSWYEIQLAEEPGNVDAQLDLLNCLKESGQYGKMNMATSIYMLFLYNCGAANQLHLLCRCFTELRGRHQDNTNHD